MTKAPHETFAPRKKRAISALQLHPGVVAAIAIFAFALLFWWARIEGAEAVDGIITGSNSDMYVYHLPVREFGFDRLKEGVMPLWNPYTHGGMPFFATYQAALFYPLNFPHWFLPADLALSLVYLIHLFAAGLFMYLWIRELGGGTVAAVFAATAYMLCSFVNHPLVWPHIVMCHAWIPLVFMLIHRTFERKRWADAALLGVVVSCQMLAGFMQGFIYTLYGAFGYLIFHAAVRCLWKEGGLRPLARPVGLVLAGLVVAPLLLTAFQWIPTFQLSGLSARPPGGLAREAILIGGSLPPHTFFSMLANPNAFKWANYSLYPGILTLLLATFAYARRRRRRELVFFSMLAIFSALLAFGENTPLFNLYMFFPTSDWFRLPHRLLILTAFSVATLAGLGCGHLIEDVLPAPNLSPKTSGRLAIFVALCGAFILALPQAGGVYVFVLLLCVLLGIRLRSPLTVGVLAILLIGLDLNLHATSPPATFPWITRDVFPNLKEEKQFLKEHVGLDRAHIFRRKRDWKNFMLNGNFGMIEGIRETSGYESLASQRYAEFCAFLETGGEPSLVKPFVDWWEWSSDSRYPHMLNLLGARYIVDDKGRDLYPESVPSRKMPKGFGGKKVFLGTLDIYENPGALPRAFYTAKVEIIREKRAVLERLAQKSFDYRKTIILEREPKLIAAPSEASAEGAPAKVVVKPQGESGIDIAADVPAAGFIFLNDILMPGWRARVDGEDIEIYRADYLFMAIPIPAGKHSIELRYRPEGFRVGVWISSLSVVVMSLLLAFDLAHRRTRRMSPWMKAEKEPGEKES